ncbi:protein-tyrosine phosphatase [Streptomyces sp. TLI_235]|nr:tyrosine-protein phosphatase [Streptomyces sp. TLI_235]PBC71366.1 protein-tyrosine phosphatase [Streptomyces sp. TLI_235]
MTDTTVFDRLCNFRDLGGHRTTDGRVLRPGLLFRSDSLGKLDGPDLARFEALGVRTVIDLRYPWEIAQTARVPELPGLTFHNLSIEHRPYDQAALGPEVDPGVYLAERYAEVAEDGADELGRVLRVIAEADAPLVFHCYSGKDRTGIVAALVLTLLGVPEEDVLADFARTEDATARLVAEWHARHPDLTLVWPGYGRAPAGIMRRFLAGLADRYGSVTDYAATRLNADPALVAALRTRLLSG